jgi:hypothetical protein
LYFSLATVQETQIWRKENLGLDGCSKRNPLLKEIEMGITKILASIEANRDLIAFNLGLEEDAGYLARLLLEIEEALKGLK